MISEINKLLFEDDKVESAERNLTKDLMLQAANEILGSAKNSFIFGTTSDMKLGKVQVMRALETRISKHITNATTGEISHKNENAKRCIERVALVLVEALFRAATVNTQRHKDDIKAFYDQKGQGGPYNFRFANYAEYIKLPQMILKLEETISMLKEKNKQEHKAMKKAERVQRMVDKEDESKEQIIGDFNVWSSANLDENNISPVLAWLYHSIEEIKGVCLPEAFELFMEVWAPELEEAGIDPEKVKETTEGRWGLSLLVTINGKAFKQLEKEALTNETAKSVLNALTSVTTLKRIGMETWVTSPVLKKGQLTGNYWVIALIKKLNELSDLDSGYPFDIGYNRNQDLKFTFIDDDEYDN